MQPGMKLVYLQSCHTRGGLNLKSITSDHYGKLSVVRPTAPNQATCVSSMRPACICQAISAGRGDNDSIEQDARTIHALETIIDQRRQELITSNGELFFLPSLPVDGSLGNLIHLIHCEPIPYHGLRRRIVQS